MGWQLYELIQEFFPAPSFIGYGKKVGFLSFLLYFFGSLTHGTPDHCRQL